MNGTTNNMTSNIKRCIFSKRKMTESKSVARDPNNEFEKQGVQFKIITEEMSPQVADFMWKNFFPDEPISRFVK